MKLKEAMEDAARKVTKRAIRQVRREFPQARATEIRERAATLLGCTRQTTFKYYPVVK